MPPARASEQDRTPRALAPIAALPERTVRMAFLGPRPLLEGELTAGAPLPRSPGWRPAQQR
jgi:hypothetical protein